MIQRHHRLLAGAALTAAATLALTACSGGASRDSDASGSSGGSGASSASAAEQVDAAQARIALTYDGGLLVLDADTLDVVGDIELAGFNRVNPSGDGRTVMVSTEEGFQVLDTGAWTADGQSYVAEPVLTDLVFDAPTPGHVVRHGDKTILFADGTGDTTVYETDDLLDSLGSGELPEHEVVGAPDAHHGVSIVLEDDTLLTTIGDAEGRSGVRALDADREEIARSEECPSVHGEGTTKGEVAVFGCSDGVLVYADGEFTKIQAEDEYGRTGNEYVTETSPIAVGDYETDPDAEGVERNSLVLTDTEAMTTVVAPLPDGVGYTWRDVARTADDDAVVLGTDGSLHVMDVETGEITDTYPVIEAWTPPIEWQDAHPALTVLDGTAYVTEPATSSIHAVDLATGDVVTTAELPAASNEIAVVTG
ncbi:zinc metallochaperone AztD [Frigoribacterium salinisoli]